MILTQRLLKLHRYSNTAFLLNSKQPPIGIWSFSAKILLNNYFYGYPVKPSSREIIHEKGMLSGYFKKHMQS